MVVKILGVHIIVFKKVNCYRKRCHLIIYESRLYDFITSVTVSSDDEIEEENNDTNLDALVQDVVNVAQSGKRVSNSSSDQTHSKEDSRISSAFEAFEVEELPRPKPKPVKIGLKKPENY